MKNYGFSGFILLIICFFACNNSFVPAIPVYEADKIISQVAPLPDAGKQVRVATWNVEGFDLGGMNLNGTYDSISSVLVRTSIDVVAFEEVQSSDLPLLKTALANAGSKLQFITSSSMSDGFNGLTVASSYPIESASEVLLPSGTTWPRSIFKVKINIGKGLTLFVCHLKSGTDASSLNKRKMQANALANYLRDTYGDVIAIEQLIVLGDMNTMNAEDRFESGNTLKYLQLQDDLTQSNDFISMTEQLFLNNDNYTWEGVVSGVSTKSALDHILLSTNLKNKYVKDSLKIYRSDPSVFMSANSDHYPVFLDLNL